MSPLQPNSPSEVDSLQEKIDETKAVTAASSNQEYSREERALLIQLAHDSITATLENRQISKDAPTPHLAERRGVFTSLYLRKELRGCVGYVLPSCTVYRATAETARAAAFNDDRFPPVTREEAQHLQIELSILLPAKSIQPEEIEIGRHGLLIGWHGRRGLLLPQVAVEHHWDRETFLEQTCCKAGLPRDAWKHGASIEAFSAEVFVEKLDE